MALNRRLDGGRQAAPPQGTLRQESTTRYSASTSFGSCGRLNDFHGWILLLQLPGKVADDAAFDHDLAAKYGLHVAPAIRKLEPPPDGIRQAEIVSGSAAV